MKILKNFAAVTLIASATASLHAATIESGDLTYDDQTNLITGGGNTYLAWDILADLTYAETIQATSEGGAYENFHIASQTEAYEFFNLANIEEDAPNDGFSSEGYTDSTSQARFGNNYSSRSSKAFFLKDSTGPSNQALVGFIESFEGSSINGNMSINVTSVTNLSGSDLYSANGLFFENPVTWLLVQDDLAQSVSEPGSLALLGLGIAGLGFTRRKSKS